MPDGAERKVQKLLLEKQKKALEEHDGVLQCDIQYSLKTDILRSENLVQNFALIPKGFEVATNSDRKTILRVYLVDDCLDFVLSPEFSEALVLALPKLKPKTEGNA